MKQQDHPPGLRTEATELTPYCAERSRFPLYEERLTVRTLIDLVGAIEEPTIVNRCALACLVGLVLAHTGKEALALPVYLDVSPEVAPDAVVCVLNLSAGTARRWWSRPPKAYTPIADHLPDLALHTDYIDLELPSKIITALRGCVGSDYREGVTLGELLTLSESEYTTNVPKLDKHLKKAGVISQIGARKIANILGAALERVTYDTFLGRQFSSTTSRSPSMDYYASYSLAHVSSSYHRALKDLTEETPSEPQYELDLTESRPTDHVRIGSHLYATTSAVRRLSKGLHDDAVGCRRDMGTPAGLVRAHNTTVAYIVTMIQALTGARSVWDPFCRLSAFMDDLGAISLSDKVMDEAHAGRLVIAPSIVFKQITHYRKHLENVASRLAVLDITLVDGIKSILSGSDPKMPAFFFLRDLREWVTVKPLTLATYHSRHWTLPRHTLRHRIASDLIASAVPSEYVAHQLGHLPGGIGPFNEYSVLSPLTLRTVLQPALESIARDQGWRELKGIQTYGHRLVKAR